MEKPESGRHPCRKIALNRVRLLESLERKLNEIRYDVEKTLDEIRGTRLPCPECRAEQSLEHLKSKRWQCQCRTVFFRVGSRRGNVPPPECDDLWPEVIHELTRITPPALVEPAISTIRTGTKLEDLYNGVKRWKVFGWPLYSVSPSASMRAFEDLPPEAALRMAINDLGFKPVVELKRYQWEGCAWEEWQFAWRGRVGSRNVLVALDKGCKLAVAISGGILPESMVPKDNPEIDAFWDTWTNFLMSWNKHKTWCIDIMSMPEECLDGTWYTEKIPRFSNLDETVEWLKQVLDQTISKCEMAAEEFLHGRLLRMAPSGLD